MQSALDALSAIFVILLATSMCRAAVFFCDRLGGTFAEAVRPHANKLASLEGLRGILAISVVAHHSSSWYSYTQTGIWSNGNHVLLARLGPFGVGQFFCISGFLFWRKLMKKGSIDFAPFYTSRFIRIAPVYYTCIFMAMCVGLYTVGLGIHVPLGQLMGSLLAWVCFTIGAAPDVDGASLARITAGVTWTLACEWIFYLSLPLLGWFARKSIRLMHLLIVLLVVFFVSKFLSSGFLHPGLVVGGFLVLREFAKFTIVGFGGGIVLATFNDSIQRRVNLSQLQLNLLLSALYALYFFLPDFKGSVVVFQFILYFAFAVVIQGGDLFGFLKSRSVRFLGSISYDVYLVHGMVLYSAMLLRGGIHPLSAQAYGIQASLAIVAIVIISTAIHFAVERPSMRLSEQLAHRSKSQGGAGLPEAVVGQ